MAKRSAWVVDTSRFEQELLRRFNGQIDGERARVLVLNHIDNCRLHGLKPRLRLFAKVSELSPTQFHDLMRGVHEYAERFGRKRQARETVAVSVLRETLATPQMNPANRPGAEPVAL